MEAKGSAGGPARGAARQRHEAEVEFNRIVAFSDGVFTIAITLLVFGLFIPDGVSNLTRTLLHQSPDLFAYAISFAVLGRFWLVHHRFFAALERFDGTLMGLNLVYLAFIGLVPFSSQVLGDYADRAAAIVLYAVNMICVNLAFRAGVAHAHRFALVRPEADDLDRQLAGPLNLAVIGVFAASIPVAFLSPTAATVMWLATFLFGRRVANVVARATIS